MVNSLFAQDAPMSQFYSNLAILNPAFSGTASADRLNLFYRNQWLRTSAGFHSFGAAYDKSLDAYNSGVGVILTNEINGAYILPSIDAVYSYRIKIKQDIFMSMGVQAGVSQKFLSAGNLVFDEAEAMSNGISKSTPDFAIGAIAFHKKMYGGFSVDHLAQPFQGVSKTSDNVRIKRKYTGFIGYLKHYRTRLISQQRVLSPNLLVQIQGLQQNINWGFSFQYDHLIGGLWLRHNIQPNIDALIVSAGFKTLDYKFSYSYDVNIGKKTIVPLGAHEISFTMLLETNKEKQYKPIKCPTFLE